jgi:hypothetical protein
MKNSPIKKTFVLILLSSVILSFSGTGNIKNTLAQDAGFSITDTDLNKTKNNNTIISNATLNTNNSNSNSNLTDLPTFTASGFLRSIIIPDKDPDIPYLTYGYWNASASDGNLTDFTANITMARINGSETHTMQLVNFKPSDSVSLKGKMTGVDLLYTGTFDVKANNQPKWQNVDAAIIIDNFNTISIGLDSRETDNHFHGQAITGLVESVKDPGGKELLLIVLNPPTLVIPAIPSNTTNSTTDANQNTNNIVTQQPNNNPQ